MGALSAAAGDGRVRRAAPGSTGTRGPTRRLAGLRVGVYGSGGAPWHHLALLALHGAAVAVVRAEDVAAGRLDDLDVVVFPGGGAFAMAGLIAPLGEDGARAVRAWVERGGTYVGSCAGSVLPVSLTGAADEAVPAARCLRLVDVTLANTGDATLGGLASPGVGRIVVRLDPAHPYAAGLPEHVELVHYNGPLFDVARAGAGVTPFAWPVAATERFTPAERFLEAPGEPHAGDTTFERCVRRGAATGVTQPLGAGRTVLFGSHPEFGLGPLGLGWGDGAELLVRTLEAVPAPTTGSSTGRPAWSVVREAPDAAPPDLAATAVADLRLAADRFRTLAEADGGEWLEPGYAASFHGVPARAAWAAELSAAAQACAAAADELAALAPDLGAADVPWLDDAQRDGQDFGAMGLRQLLALLRRQLDDAERLLPSPAIRPAHAYDLFDSHPFHLAMGSYLSAAGMAAAALLTVTVLHALRGREGVNGRALLWV